MACLQQQTTLQIKLLMEIQTCRKLSWLSTCGTPGRASWAESMCEQLVVLIRLQTGPGIWKDMRTVFHKPWVTCPRWLILWYHFSHTSLLWDDQLKNFVSYRTCFIVSCHWGDGYEIICDQFWCRNLKSCFFACTNARDFHPASTFFFSFIR